MTMSNQSQFPGFFLSPKSHLIGFCKSYIKMSLAIEKGHLFYCWVDSSTKDNWMLLLTSLLLLMFTERNKRYVLLWDWGLDNSGSI
jgi:hypothetical protein